MFDKLPFQNARTPSSFFTRSRQSHNPLYRSLRWPCCISSGMTCILNLTRSMGLASETDPAMNSHERREDLTRCRGDSSATAIAQTVINILNLFAALTDQNKLPKSSPHLCCLSCCNAKEWKAVWMV